MAHHLKALGLALIAVFALSALAVSSASAADKITVAGGGTALLTGVSHDGVFTITKATPLKVECTTATSAAPVTVTSGTESVTGTPSLTGRIGATPHGTKCDSAVGEVTVDVNGCHGVATGSTTGSDGGTDATGWIECDKIGEHIKVTTSVGCTILIPEQTPTSGGATSTNEAGPPKDVKVTATVTGITYTTTGALCAAGGLSSEANNADLTGTATVKGYEDNNGVEGAQVGIESS